MYALNLINLVPTVIIPKLFNLKACWNPGLVLQWCLLADCIVAKSALMSCATVVQGSGCLPPVVPR